MVKRTTTKKKGLPNCLMDIAYGLSSKNAASEELTPNVGCLLKRLVSSSFVHCLSTAFNALWLHCRSTAVDRFIPCCFDVVLDCRAGCRRWKNLVLSPEKNVNREGACGRLTRRAAGVGKMWGSQ
jgi:hypothetical protein